METQDECVVVGVAVVERAAAFGDEAELRVQGDGGSAVGADFQEDRGRALFAAPVDDGLRFDPIAPLGCCTRAPRTAAIGHCLRRYGFLQDPTHRPDGHRLCGIDLRRCRRDLGVGPLESGHVVDGESGHGVYHSPNTLVVLASLPTRALGCALGGMGYTGVE